MTSFFMSVSHKGRPDRIGPTHGSRTRAKADLKSMKSWPYGQTTVDGIAPLNGETVQVTRPLIRMRETGYNTFGSVLS